MTSTPFRSSAVVRLILAGGPAAITGGVWAVVVDAVKRQAGWTQAHVCEELAVVGAPSRVDGNASTAVVLISVVRRIQAACLRAFQCAVFLRAVALLSARQADKDSVLEFLVSGALAERLPAALTAATGRVARHQMASLHDDFHPSAIAVTQPTRLTFVPNNDQITEPLSRAISEFHVLLNCATAIAPPLSPWCVDVEVF